MSIRKDTLTGIIILAFGIFVGGIGLASAGIGIGLPVIPVGIYLIWRGYCLTKQRANTDALDQKADSLDFERSSKGQIGIGIIVLLIGIGTSAMIIGIPIAMAGGYLIYKGIKKDKLQKAELSVAQPPSQRDSSKIRR